MAVNLHNHESRNEKVMARRRGVSSKSRTTTTVGRYWCVEAAPLQVSLRRTDKPQPPTRGRPHSPPIDNTWALPVGTAGLQLLPSAVLLYFGSLGGRPSSIHTPLKNAIIFLASFSSPPPGLPAFQLPVTIHGHRRSGWRPHALGILSASSS